MKNYRFTVVIEKDEDVFFAYCPELQGCYTQGDTWEEALENIKVPCACTLKIAWRRVK